MVPIDTAVAQLSSLASQLNKETDALSDIILDLERQLANTKVGVSLWLERNLLAETGDGYKQDAWVLGYAKLGDSWRLAAKPVTVTWEHIEEADHGDLTPFTKDRGEPVPLLNAPRAVRVDASAYLEELVNRLAEKVKGFIGNIEQAKRFVATPPIKGNSSTQN